MSAVFDDPNLIGSAGLVPVMRLAGKAGLHDLMGEHLSVPCPNAAVKAAEVVAGMLAPTETPHRGRTGQTGESATPPHQRRLTTQKQATNAHPKSPSVDQGLADVDRALEINTRLPQDPLLLRWWRQERGQRVTFGSDAHEPHLVAAGLAEAAAFAEAEGFRPQKHPEQPWFMAHI